MRAPGVMRMARATVAALAAGPAALAQAPPGASSDPTIITPRAQLEGLQFTDFGAALELEWRRDVDEVDRSGEPEDRTEEDRMREILELSTKGFVGHPNLLELDLRGRLWLEQRWLDQTLTSDTRSDQTLYEWDASGSFLKETDLPFTLYSRQNITDIDRDFGGSLENTFRETGARMSYRSETVPTNLQVFRREIRQKDRAFNQDFDIDQDTIMADGRIQMSGRHQIAWDAKYDEIEESGDLRTTRNFDRFEGNATHSLQFGDDEQHLVRTRMRFFDETGDRELRQVRIDPRLRLRHSDDLTSWYDYSFGRDDRPEQEQTRHRATANVRHELFESLSTVGTAGMEFLDIPTADFDSDEFFVRLNTEYRKQVPNGQFTAALDLSASTLDQSDRGAAIAIADDIFVFNALDRIVINERNVDPTSLFITDAAGIIVYSENVDYLVRAFADRIEIQRLTGGNIAPGQAVAIDYVIGPEPGGTTDTTGVGIDLRYTFEETFLQGLSVYFQYFEQDERRSFTLDDFPENDFDDTRYGVEYSRWNIYGRAEYQERDGTLSSFDAMRFEGRYIQPLGTGSALVFSGIFQEIDRDPDDLRTRSTTLTGQWNQRFENRLNLALIVRYQWSDDSDGFESEAFEQQADLNWRRGRTEVYAQVRNSFNDSNFDDTTVQRFVVGVRREF